MAGLNSIITTRKTREDQAVYRAMHLLKKRLRKPGEAFNSPNAVRQFFALNLAGYEQEVFSALWLDTQLRLIAAEHLAVGTLTQTSVYPREVARRGLQLNAAAVIFAHNHPSGCAEPSQSDLILTSVLMTTLALFDIRVVDHFIVAGADVLSLEEKGLLGEKDFSSKDEIVEPQKQEANMDKGISTNSNFGFDVLSLRAQMRAAFSLLQSTDAYASNETLCDVGFALIDADKRLNAIHERIDAMGCA